MSRDDIARFHAAHPDGSVSRRVRADNAEVQRSIEEEQGIFIQSIFGEDIVDAWDEARGENSDAIHEELARVEGVFRVLFSSRREEVVEILLDSMMQVLEQQPDLEAYVQSHYAVNAGQIMAVFRAAQHEGGGISAVAEYILDSMYRDQEDGVGMSFGAEAMVDLLQKYNDSFVMQSHFFEKEQLSMLQNEAYAEVCRWADEGSIPVTTQTIQQRLTGITISFIDPLTALVDEMVGGWYQRSHVISIALQPSISVQELKNIVLHEYVHAVSGVSHTAEKMDGGGVYIDHTKSGMSFTVQNRQRSQHRLWFTWLNEALTEDVVWSGNSSRDGDGDVYAEERALLQVLVATGLDKDLAYAAYFESWKETEEQEHSLPHTGDFFYHVARVFEKGFLQRLQRIVEYQPTTSKKNGKKERYIGHIVSRLQHCTTAQEVVATVHAIEAELYGNAE